MDAYRNGNSGWPHFAARLFQLARKMANGAGPMDERRLHRRILGRPGRCRAGMVRNVGGERRDSQLLADRTNALATIARPARRHAAAESGERQWMTANCWSWRRERQALKSKMTRTEASSFFPTAELSGIRSPTTATRCGWRCACTCRSLAKLAKP